MKSRESDLGVQMLSDIGRNMGDVRRGLGDFVVDRTGYDSPVTIGSLAFACIAVLGSMVTQRPTPMRVYIDRVAWFAELKTIGQGSYGQVKLSSKEVEEAYDIKGPSAIKRTFLL